MNGARLETMAGIFAQLSLLAIGGGNTVIPDMQRQFVQAHGWLTGPEFAALVALSQAAPGPNVMVVGLIGFHVAGVAGALVATLAMCGPAALLTIATGRVWHRLRGTHLGRALELALAPLTVGLVLASAWTLSGANGVHALPLGLTAAVALLSVKYTRAGLALLAASAAVAAVAALAG